MFYSDTSLSYSDKMSFLESRLDSINSSYYNQNQSNTMNTYMYLSSITNSGSYSHSSSSNNRNMGRAPNYTVGQWSIAGMF